jgi:riboflavin synthase
MFTGIVQSIGTIAHTEVRGGDVRLTIEAAASADWNLRLGDSVSVDGVCLTVVALDGSRFAADVSTETLARTTLGERTAGSAVNLEPALCLGDRLGGHLVSGHVDGRGQVLAIADDARAQRWTFAAPVQLMRYIAVKGSITVDGVSLTVNAVAAQQFEVALIPHTLAVTTLGRRRIGDRVNLEIDLIARYVERLQTGGD